MERLNIYTSFDREKIEALFSEIKKQFKDARLEWYKADLPFAMGVATPDSCKNKTPSDKSSANCAIIKIKGKDAFFIAGKSLGLMTFFYRENFSEEDAAKISSATFSPGGIVAQSGFSTEGWLIKYPILYYIMLISMPLMIIGGLVVMFAVNFSTGLLIITFGVVLPIGPLLKVRKIKQQMKNASAKN